MRTDAKQERITAAGAHGAAGRPSACEFNQAQGRVRPSYLRGRIEGVVTQANLWSPETMLGVDKNQLQE
jgi:hypothetical protein